MYSAPAVSVCRFGSTRLARPPTAILERLPSPPLTRDQLTMLELGDNVCDPAPAAAAFGVDLLPLDEQLDRSIVR